MHGYSSDEEKQRVFLQIFNDCYADLCLMAKARVGDEDLAKTIVVEKIAAFRKAGLLTVNDESTRKKLFKAVSNACTDHWRKSEHRKKVFLEMPYDAAEPWDQPYSMDNKRNLQWVLTKLQQVLDELPKKRREVLKDMIYEKRSIKEVAMKYNLARSTVYEHRRKGVVLLKKWFARWGQAASKAFMDFLRS